MDPEETLRRAEQALRDLDFGEALDLLAAYDRWRRFGGFEPHDGDRRAAQVRRTIRRWAKSRLR